MNKYESSIKQIYAPITSVYQKLSDLTHLQSLKERVNDPMFENLILERAGDKVKPEQVAQIKAAVSKMEFTPDTVTGEAGPLGQVTLRIIERQENKCIKFALEGSPIQANLWIQLLPTATGCKMRCTIGAELNFFIRQMVGSKLQEASEGIANMLSMIPY